jgi:hypothetical protein
MIKILIVLTLIFNLCSSTSEVASNLDQYTNDDDSFIQSKHFIAAYYPNDETDVILEDGNNLKNSDLSFNNLHGAWVKRLANVLPENKRKHWNNLSGMWGKRSLSSEPSSSISKRDSAHWNHLRGMWGKRSISGQYENL